MDLIHTPHATPPAGHYSQAVRANGFVFVSGQLGFLPAARSGERPQLAQGVAAQTEAALRSMAAILQAAGYRPPASRLVAATGFLGLLAAPFGAHSVTLGAISAAICTGPEAHAEPSKRYIAAATYGISYFALSIVAGAVAVFFQALPAALLAALAGLALLGTIMGGMAAAMANPQRREAALITLLATASGFSFWGIGSAFWGLVAGLLAHTVFEFRRKPAA